jgi:hypothetical protein
MNPCCVGELTVLTYVCHVVSPHQIKPRVTVSIRHVGLDLQDQSARGRFLFIRGCRAYSLAND